MSGAQSRTAGPGPRARGGVTLKDVAKAAGVSVSTASRALAGNPLVESGTRLRVEQAAMDLNYVVNGLAQSMMGVGTKTLAFVTNAFLAEPFARIARGTDEVAKQHNTMLLMNSTNDSTDDERAAISTLAQQRTAGVLLVGSRQTDKQYVRQLAQYRDQLAAVNAKLVLCGSPKIRGLADVPSVDYDHRGGTYLATMALLEAGHRNIAFLGYDDRSTAHERFIGYRDALQANGQYINHRSMLVAHSDNTKETLVPAANHMLSLPEERRPTAIVCVTDFAAYRVYHLAKQHGLRIPEDLSVTGFDDLSSNDALTPTLSSIEVPYEEIGQYGARLALGLSVDQGDHPVFPVKFHARESVASPAPSAQRI